MGSFSINTNIASLQAQNYLRINQNFQNLTINQVTSGLRIVNSGVDAAGLAVANGDRSNEAVLTQGVQNATNGLNQLQIADGGMSNISQLLDRARTLASESASGAFTGDRGVLNSEFQSVIGEINRQAQSIGLNQGGVFATNLNVFVGGGESSNGITATQNGTVSINLSQSTVDAKSLGLEGVQAAGTAGTDLGTGSSTSVQNIVTNSTNLASISNNTTTFTFTGPGFSDTTGSNVLKVAVNLTGVTDTGTLVTAINQAIQNAGNGSSQQATAFKNANITASINTDSTGKEQLAFSSPNTAFQVQGADQVATALMGNFSSGSTGNVATTAATAASNYTAAAEAGVQIRILGAGLTGAPADDLSVTIGATDSLATTVANINTQIAANSAVAATGIQAVADGSKIQFVGPTGSTFQVATAGDTGNVLGFGSYLSSSGAFNYNSLTAAAASTATTQGVAISVNGGATQDLGVLTSSATQATALATLNTAIQGNATLKAAGLTAIANGANIELTTTTGSSDNFRVELYGGTGNAFGFGASPAGSVAATAASSVSAYTAKDSINSLGAQESQNATNTDVYQFTGLTGTQAQTVTLSAVDAQGNQHSLNVGLTASNAGTLTQALSTINADILASNDSTLKQIGAFQEQGTSGVVNGVEGIRFMSAGGPFNVSLGATPGNVGVADGVSGTNVGSPVLTSVSNGAGSTADISNISTATAAVNQLATSVASLGSAQAAVGRGENLMNYSINLANSQLTNLAASESSIRDANMAAESANLTKASIQLQAGIAALAQANSAPQMILTLLQHP